MHRNCVMRVTRLFGYVCIDSFLKLVGSNKYGRTFAREGEYVRSFGDARGAFRKRFEFILDRFASCYPAISRSQSSIAATFRDARRHFFRISNLLYNVNRANATPRRVRPPSIHRNVRTNATYAILQAVAGPSLQHLSAHPE